MKNLLSIIIISICLTVFTFSNEINFSQIKNWSSADTVDYYDASNLWEYINGAADLFYTYGFQNLQSCELSSDDVEVVVDVYNMGTRLNAFGMYKTERGEQNDLLNIGVETVITSPHQSLMLKDIFYVKLNVYEGELKEGINKDLLQSISEILPGSNKYPSEFNLLPAENKVKNSEHFAKESYLGLSELTNCLYADYKQNDKEYQYFIIIPALEATYDHIRNKFSEKWKLIESESVEVLYKKIPYSGIVGITKTKKGILGVTNCETVDQAVERFKNKDTD